MPAVGKISLREKLALVRSYWDPKIIGELNGQLVKPAKLKGEFVRHTREAQDEPFLVLRGSFVMELREGNLELNEGDVVIVPRGVEHRSVARGEAHVLLFEPAGTVNTGDVINELTRHDLDRI